MPDEGLSHEELNQLLLQTAGRMRYTQDSPVFVDVWMQYCGKPLDARADLLLEPHHRAEARELADKVRGRLPSLTVDHQLAYAADYVAIKLTLPELLGGVLPLSPWWKHLVRPLKGSVFEHLTAFADGRPLAPSTGGEPIEVPPPEDELKWLLTVAGRLLTNTSDDEARERGFDDLRILTAKVLDMLESSLGNRPTDDPGAPLLWSVSRNREVHVALWRSRQTVKADAACRLFPADTEGLAWAVIDSGIDARHSAFIRRDEDQKLVDVAKQGDFGNQTNVRATYDFTGLRRRIAAALLEGERMAAQMQDALNDGLLVDWRGYLRLIEVKHNEEYRAPVDPHGTHVAGTIAGDWRNTDGKEKPLRHTLQGICPGLTLYDLRVLDDSGYGDEFGVLAALSFVRWRNAQSGGTVIHGVNISISLEHDVRNSACGRSPVCLEAERVHNAGVLVVTAAGNQGRAEYTYQGVPSEGYRIASITDPGNTEVAITVGSTHRLEPHAYGVSYFSSRGPTGDGRAKPDIVAPGEKITAPIPGENLARMDGTSMAAPHVSGAAALLIARHRELVGRPAEVKRVLCESATDLGRERQYQGHGVLDILRALQAV